MQEIMNFLKEYESIVSFIQGLAFVIISIMLYRKTGNIKYLQGVIEEMNYQKGSYFLTEQVDKKTGEVKKEKNPSLKYAQSFDSKVPIYRLNKATNELEKTDEFIDLKETINSFKEQALESMFERFMPKLIDDTADYTNVMGDLDMLSESFAIAEEYRDKFGLADTMSIQDIFKYVENYSNELKKKINLVENKGDIKNEKEIIEESK